MTETNEGNVQPTFWPVWGLSEGLVSLSLLSQSVDGTSILFWKLWKVVNYHSNALE